MPCCWVAGLGAAGACGATGACAGAFGFGLGTGAGTAGALAGADGMMAGFTADLYPVTAGIAAAVFLKPIVNFISVLVWMLNIRCLLFFFLLEHHLSG